MKEREQILELWAEAERAGESAVLVTVVKTRGSSYRLPGARLLLTRSGHRAGSVSGGCLEDDLLKKAWWLTESGPVIRRYDTTPEGEIATSYGLGCSGVIHLLLERLEPAKAQILELIREVQLSRRPVTIAHILEPARLAGKRFVMDSGAAAHLENVETFVELIAPPVHLAIFGAGDDAVPLVELARHLGWRVSVFDGRAHHARPGKFPRADAVVARPANESAADLQADAWTAAVLMSHSYSQDLDALRQLARKPLRYLGILGPRNRTAQLLSDAEIHASKIAEALHCPIGLDIGADGPHQVALAVIAEIQAVLNGRQGGLLRAGSGSIHAPEDAPGDKQEKWVRSIVCA